MATTFIEAVATAIDAGTSLTTGTNLFIGWMPDQPDTAVSLHEYEGELATYLLGTAVIDKPRIQVMSRSASYLTARDMLTSIRNLVDVHDTTLSGIVTLRLVPNGSIVGLGRDEKDRWEFALSLTGTVMR